MLLRVAKTSHHRAGPERMRDYGCALRTRKSPAVASPDRGGAGPARHPNGAGRGRL